MKTKITIPVITPPTVEVLYEGEYFWTANEYEFNTLRVAIKENQEEGFSFIFKDKVYPIDKDGRIENWPIGCFDILLNCMRKLFIPLVKK